MIPLYDVDPERVVAVQKGIRTGRGCGKTIAKMVQLLSFLRYVNDGSRYLFICENDDIAKTINHHFYYWVGAFGLYTQSNNNDMYQLTGELNNQDYNVSIQPPIPNSFLGMLNKILQPSRSTANIYIKFIHAGWELERGIKRFDKIIIDVSRKTRETYNKEISKVILYGQKNG